MPAQPRDPSADETPHGHQHSADDAIFDEDSLREDQPYANLEDEPNTHSTPNSEKAGGGSR